LPQLAHVIGQLVQAFVPKLPIPFEPVDCRLEGFGRKPARAPLRRVAAQNQTCAFQDLEKLRNRREADRKRLGQFGDRSLAFGQPCKNRAAR
jgi:hypothetical protein